MSQDVNDSVSYLRALQRSSAPPEGTAAAPARETSPAQHSGPEGAFGNAREQFQGTDKRRSTRYKCDGSAEIREDGCDVQTFAAFTDVSLHGCYVEAQATYPVGTVLHLKLDANGVRVESKGIVRVSYPYLGMGIAFAEVAEETRERLKQMLGSIARPTAIMGPGMASSLPARGSMDALPPIADPRAAVQALTEFFENRQMLMREDFLRILRKSQNSETKP
jgi:PilZ domain